ncbi:PAS domain-containing sensor histidine kinase [Philodulcilactobacillus myokoensis]|uniref:histidine kinase n=1 Tax=Philodulcilactobacillus myokoensis TaxID=2929573 RepID=A0A9W6ERS6_9LACO|nr:cell wall metabolism sensor histidine kinase WalK [Philodulcilactobacillus myokoensis]GLB46250.1 PAS domain-containing sensor histidine kinase [Philodulcilactobacillus myokoensis]
MNNKLRFFRSIHFKIALVFALMLLMTLEIVGAVFVNQLEQNNLSNFKSSIQPKQYLSNSLAQKLTMKNTKKANDEINSLLTDYNNGNSTVIYVTDANNTIRGSNSDQFKINQKGPYSEVKSVLAGGHFVKKSTIDGSDNNRYYTIISPLTRNQNNQPVGAIFIRGNLTPIYNDITGVTKIYLAAAVIAIMLGIIIAIVISRAITRPIDEMKKQTQQIARGDYSGHVDIYGDDELGDLADSINTLSYKIEESQESTESERRRLDSVLTNMTDGVLATDRRGNIIIANDKAYDFLNQNEENVIGHSILSTLGIQKKYTLRQLLENPKEITLNFSNSSRDLILHTQFSLIRHESGFISGLVCVLHDITEQQKIDADRKQFVSNVSHELRTPLTSVHSYLETLMEGAWKDKEFAPHFIGVAQNETNRMIRMVRDLLTLSRIDSNTQKLNMEMVNINELFNYILKQFDMIIKNKKTKGSYKIKKEITKDDLWVELDTDRFTQVIDNIMNNAMKYSPDGGTITCRLYENNNHVMLSISDQGMGIPKQALPHIFERFYRVDKARSRKQGGSGLGLAISKEVINSLGGKIWVESKEHHGSTFYISLPYEPMKEDLWDED